MTDIFTGVGVALVTLFTESGDVDVETTTEHAVRLVDEGITSVVVGGSTGEAPTLTSAERAELVRSVKSAVRVPVISGTGAASGRQAAEQTRDSVQAGADAVLVLSPIRANDPTAYYRAVAAELDGTPMLAYHFPVMSAPGIPVPLLADLPIAGVKDSSGDVRRLMQTIDAFGGAIYSGAAPLTLYCAALGLPGMILGIANAAPADSVAAWNGDVRAQRRLSALDTGAMGEFPAGIKAATAKAFDTSTVSRMGN
ncbi:dihydrodipicolinate synthase family protein [Blastococcus sp. Marseille-P5729]|uniref:dihydrodipicolinate synthase family protein n=1 Tax=Blastococcus sp. Marseille-P5729 TaxID=2086582 RepID=UPI00131DF8F1|nr:dihydrodipicolinate synthase family protein [Blastococcus sp. Marseille-P5729]